MWGQLDNGLRFVILPTRGVPGRASLRLYMKVGSFMETEDQRGLAHFLEHMAFNGTRSFPAGELVKYFQRLGMNFGPHANAMTSWDRTVYQLELPRAEPELLGDGLKVFRDFLDGMSLDPKEIDRERRVIFSEILARNSSGYREAAAELKFEMPDTLVPGRMPLGQTTSVAALKPSQFVEFYEKWYTPGAGRDRGGRRSQRQTSGEPDPEELRRREGARAASNADLSLGKISPLGGPVACFHSESDVAAVTVELDTVVPQSKEPDSVASAPWLLCPRPAQYDAQSKIRKTNAAPRTLRCKPRARASSVDSIWRKSAALAASCQPRQWQAALGSLEQELRRALEFGFSDAEFAQARSTMLAALQSRVDQAETRQADSLADDIVESLACRTVFTHPSDDLALATGLLRNATKADCQSLLRTTWDPRALRIWVHGNLQLTGDASEQILAAYETSRAIAVQPPQEEKAARLTFADLGPAGKIVSRKQIAGLDFVEATFNNHVRINVKQTKLEKSKVNVIVRFGNGLKEQPADKPGLALFTSATFIHGGLQSINMNDLMRNLSDKDVGLQFSVTDDAFQFSGECSPSLLEMELQLCTSFLTSPGFRDEARDHILAGSENMYAQLEHTPEGVLSNGAFSFLRSGDPRFSVPARDVLKKLTMKDVQAWLAEPLRAAIWKSWSSATSIPIRQSNWRQKRSGACPSGRP